MSIEFGTMGPCRTCHGSGRAGDAELSVTIKVQTNDGKVRRRKVCPQCMGKGYLPASEADKPSLRS